MKQSMSLRMGQALAMTPALQQAIKLLQLSSLDLQQEIRQAVESNLMLELVEDDPPEPSIEQEAAGQSADSPPGEEADTNKKEESEELPVEIEWEESYETTPGSRSVEDEENLYEYRQANLTTGATLNEHLLWQAGLAPFDEKEGEIAAHLIDAINDDGYLEDWPALAERLQTSLGVTLPQIERVLKQIQDFDPPGVAARDLAECLRLQITQFSVQTPEREPAQMALGPCSWSSSTPAGFSLLAARSWFQVPPK